MMTKQMILHWLRIFAFMALMAHSVAKVLADHQDPVVRVNQNKPTELFEQSHGGKWQETQQQYDLIKKQAIDSLSSDENLAAIGGASKEQVQVQAAGYNGQSLSELNTQANAQMITNGVLDDFYVDYTKSLNQQHLEDAKILAKAQEQLLTQISAKLQEFGVDCHTVKGEIEQEPIYFLQIEQRPIKQTVYNQAFCEELRNQYNCTDSLTMRCIKRSKRFKDWQSRSMRISGNTLLNEKRAWGFLEHIKPDKKWYKSA